MKRDSAQAAPIPGETVETVRGRQRVTAVIEMPLIEPTVYLQPEDGGQEWSIPVAQFATLLVAHED